MGNEHRAGRRERYGQHQHRHETATASIH
jgi:hypothetical protein